MIMQDYRESFPRSSFVTREQGSFLCGQMLKNLRRPLRRIVNRDGLSEEDNWDTFLDFEFTNVLLLSVSQLMEKTDFRTKAMQAAKGRINVKRERKKGEN